jgi:hypothetical protein
VIPLTFLGSMLSCNKQLLLTLDFPVKVACVSTVETVYIQPVSVIILRLKTLQVISHTAKIMKVIITVVYCKNLLHCHYFFYCEIVLVTRETS